MTEGTLSWAAANLFSVSLRRQSSALFRLLYLRTRSWQCWPPLLSSLFSLRSEVKVYVCGRCEGVEVCRSVGVEVCTWEVCM